MSERQKCGPKRRQLSSHGACRCVCLALASFFLLCSDALALDWQQGAGFRSTALPIAAGGKTGFTRLVPETTGIAFSNQLSDLTAAKNCNLGNGSGVPSGGVECDRWSDIYFCRLDGTKVRSRT